MSERDKSLQSFTKEFVLVRF